LRWDDAAKHVILMVEDDAGVRAMVRFVLEQAGFQVMEAADVPQAQACLAQQVPALMLLDWMLPGTSGMTFARQIRCHPVFKTMPLMMLTARGEEDARVRGLECGADDYITKPFSPRELVARIRAVLRRADGSVATEVITLQGLCIDVDGRSVTADAQPVLLGPTEFRLLHFFVTHRRRVYTRAQLRTQVFQNNPDLKARAVDVSVHRIRQKLAPFGYDRWLQTVHRSGYRFCPENEA
jgi:two-component system phosphate regulon response regulator PhoB